MAIPKHPVIGIPCDHRMIGPHPFHAAGEKYVMAAREGAGGSPLLIPVLEHAIGVDELLACVDGLLLTGSPSNVAPSAYGGPSPRDGVMQDRRRDQTTLPLIRRAVERGVPVLAICRGFQEMNVAFGGSLHQHLEEVPGRFDHREVKDMPLERQYAPVHSVRLTEGGVLHGLAGREQIIVNSLHGQGVDRLAPGLTVEAKADDGTIEAIMVMDARTFALGVQWHPEWRFWEDAFSTRLFAEFGAAARAAAAAKRTESP